MVTCRTCWARAHCTGRRCTAAWRPRVRPSAPSACATCRRTRSRRSSRHSSSARSGGSTRGNTGSTRSRSVQCALPLQRGGERRAVGRELAHFSMFSLYECFAHVCAFSRHFHFFSLVGAAYFVGNFSIMSGYFEGKLLNLNFLIEFSIVYSIFKISVSFEFFLFIYAKLSLLLVLRLINSIWLL